MALFTDNAVIGAATGVARVALKVVGKTIERAESAIGGPRTPAMSVAPSSDSYRETLHTLSEASAHGKHFEAFKDIAWDSPEFDVSGGGVEWTLPDIDPLTHTDWYRTLPAERRSEIARLRLAAITKCGSQFEQLLLLGGTQFLMGLPNDNPEFRYFMHELTEETHHIQMFQEFTNRACPEANGVRPWLKNVFPLVGMLGTVWPSFFFQIILAGEEPIDHVQKSILRSGGTNPLLDRIMQIHVAEEARHIGFAHAWLSHHAPARSPLTRVTLGLATPFLMSIGFWAIMVPSPKDAEAMGIPREVFREAYGWNSPLLSRLRADCAADVRALAIETNLLTALTRPAWKLAGVDGRPSRHRAEPTRQLAA